MMMAIFSASKQKIKMKISYEPAAVSASFWMEMATTYSHIEGKVLSKVCRGKAA